MRRATDERSLAILAAVSFVLGISVAIGDPEPRPGCEPWSRCSPDAAWLRRVLASIGYPDAGDTGSALVVGGGGAEGRGQRFVWATTGAGSGCGWGDDWVKVGDVEVCGDAVRVSWQAQGRRIWVEPPDALLAPLVRASQRIPHAPPGRSRGRRLMSRR